jgi:putative ABC transport system permease protein
MRRHYLVIAFRNIIKYWNYSIINIGGLAIGLASFIFIILYIQDELKYDAFNDKANRIFRVNRLYNSNDVDEDAATCSFPCGPTLVFDYPDIVEESVRFFNGFRPQWFFDYQKSEEEDVRFYEKYFILADSNVFKVFSFPFLEGDPSTALERPGTVVITESTAKRYFGDEPAIGKVLRVEEQINFEVTGVMKDLPSQSHFKIDILGSLNTFRQLNQGQFPQTWIWNPCWTYVLLHKGIDPGLLDEKFPEFYKNHYTDLKDADVSLYLQPLKDIHLRSHHVYEMRANSNIIYVYILSIISFIVLIMACINFMNLSTASSAGRAKEISMKKIFGGFRYQLTRQFMGEAIVQTFVALIIAVLMVELLLQDFNHFTGKEITAGFLFNPVSIIFLIFLGVVVGFIAGVYPAFFLSSFKPLIILKSNLKGGAKTSMARKILVIIQYSISISLIIATLVVFAQLNYLRNAELGFNKDQIILIENYGQLQNRYRTFKEELLKNPDIKYVTGSEDVLGINHNTRAYEIEGLTPGQQFYIPAFLVDWDFIETYGIKVVEGRAFSRKFPTDTLQAVMINETMAKDLGWTNEEAIGKKVRSADGGDERVIGVFKDFYAMSLHRPMNKFIIDMFRRPEVFAAIIAIKVNTKNYGNVISYIEETWNRFAPTRPFNYYFLDQQLDGLYKDEAKFGRFTLMLTILAIIIASMGLIGLTSFLAEQRTKEIGIRRVLGASFKGIIFLMSREFIILILLANLIAWPVTYFATSGWLDNYAKHISTKWLFFILSAAIALLLALIITGYKALRISMVNPAKTLRYE